VRRSSEESAKRKATDPQPQPHCETREILKYYKETRISYSKGRGKPVEEEGTVNGTRDDMTEAYFPRLVPIRGRLQREKDSSSGSCERKRTNSLLHAWSQYTEGKRGGAVRKKTTSKTKCSKGGRGCQTSNLVQKIRATTAPGLVCGERRALITLGEGKSLGKKSRRQPVR